MKYIEGISIYIFVISRINKLINYIIYFISIGAVAKQRLGVDLIEREKVTILKNSSC